MVLRIIKIIIIFIFNYLTTHSLAKSNEYYQSVITNIITNCNSTCQKIYLNKEVHKAFFVY